MNLMLCWGYRDSVSGILPTFINRNLYTFQYTDGGTNFNNITKPVRFHDPTATITSGDCKLHSICNNRCIKEQGAVLTGVDVAYHDAVDSGYYLKIRKAMGAPTSMPRSSPGNYP